MTAKNEDINGTTDPDTENPADTPQDQNTATHSPTGTELVRYEAMCKAIQAAHDIDEVKEIHDKARAIEIYAAQARNKKAERQARAIRIRAERRAGQLLRETEKAKGGRPTENQSYDATSSQRTLRELGISKTQSARWQMLALVPEEEFEAAIVEGDATTAGIINAHIRAPKVPAKDVVEVDAGWLWCRLSDFKRRGLLARDPNDLLRTMTPEMQAATLEIAPRVAAWLTRICR
jgi:hypothetical protein